jgi:5-methylcytosine-specific restriction protein A
MSEHRRPEIPFSEAPRGSCRWCGEDILHEAGDHEGQVNRRRRWHQTCVDEYNESDPREARKRIRRRDRGICAACGVDTKKLKREFKAIGRGRVKAVRSRGFKPRKSLWELDHVVPLIDGGGHSDDNLQTLCTPCHTQKTAQEARERADRSRDRAAESQGSTSPEAASCESAAAKTVRSATRKRRSKRNDDLETLISAADATNSRVSNILAEIAKPPS